MSRVCSSVFSITFLTLSAIVGCESEKLTGPPELRLGRDLCEECGMIINEDRCSSAMLVEQDRRRAYLLFDDLGCMLKIEFEGLNGRKVIERHVHDYETKTWISVEDATFLSANPDELATPMASGMVAFGTRAAALNAVQEFGGRLLSYQELQEARLEREAARRGINSRQPE